MLQVTPLMLMRSSLRGEGSIIGIATRGLANEHCQCTAHLSL
jgi:hypothetical protein